MHLPPLPLLSQAAEWLYRLNPTMSPDPPRANVPDTYCYMGADGGIEGAVLCQDLDYSMSTCVGSWLLSPEHHIVEGLLVTIVALGVLRVTLPKLYQTTDVAHLRIQHPVGARAVSLVCFVLMMCYKYFGYPKRVFYVVMPCNMQWALSFVQCWWIPESWTMAQYTLLQFRLTFLMSVVIAIVTPETDDCLLPGEFAFYWINHALLLILPAAYVVNGSVSCCSWPRPSPSVSSSTSTTSSSSSSSSSTSLVSYNRRWWQYSCAIMAVFYFLPVTVLAIGSGLNLNFMLHPPHDHFLLYGPYFRLVAVASLATLFAVSRLLVAAFEQLLLLLVVGLGPTATTTTTAATTRKMPPPLQNKSKAV